MSVKVEASGKRSVEITFDVEATPEQVWQAIATGEGVSSWLMPAELEMRDGKPAALKMSWGPGMESSSRVTTYDAPRLFALEADSMMPGSPPIAAEWHIEARGGGTCKVRIVQSLFASTDEWDGQLEVLEGGWSGFLATLKIYLKHFAGQSSRLHKFMGPTTGTEAQVWDKLTSTLGLKDARPGQRWSSNHGAPALSGVVEYLSEGPYDALVRLDSPGPGIAAFGTVDMGGPTMVGMNLYSYGGADYGAREMAKWQAWLQEHFPAPAA